MPNDETTTLRIFTVSGELVHEDVDQVGDLTWDGRNLGAQLVEAAAEPIVSRLAGNARMQRFVDQFLDRLDSELNIMRDAAQSADLATLAASARWLKGSGGTVGFDVFTEPAKELEACAKNGDGQAIPGLLKEIHSLATRIQRTETPADTLSRAAAQRMTGA